MLQIRVHDGSERLNSPAIHMILAFLLVELAFFFFCSRIPVTAGELQA